MPASHDDQDAKTRLVAFGDRLALGESARWDPHRREFTWTDVQAGSVYAATWDGRTLRPSIVMTFPEVTPLCLPTAAGHLVALRSRVVEVIDGESTSWSQAPLESDHRFNDGAFDPAGRLVIGSMHTDGHAGAGALWCLGRDEPRCLRTEMTIPNGIAWNDTGDRIYWVDSGPGVVHVTKYEQDTGTLGDDLATWDLTRFGGVPDGIVATEDTLLVAMWDGWQVLRLHAVSGDLVDRYPVPAQRPTSCAVSDGRTLLVTTATYGLDDPGEGKTDRADGRVLLMDL